MSTKASLIAERCWPVAALQSFKREGNQDYYLVRWEVSTLSAKDLYPFLHLAQEVYRTGEEAIFRVVWRDSWEPVVELSDVAQLIHEYWVKYIVFNS